MPRAQLRLLGGFEAYASGERPVVLPARSQALLARLAFRPGEVHLRDKLAALLWGDAPAPRARQSLRQALLTIRRSWSDGHPDLVLDQGDALALNPAAVDVDTASFERLVETRTPEALEGAASLYRGELLEGIAGQSAPFEEWLLAERERLRELALEVFGRLLKHQSDAGNVAGAIQTAGRLLAIEPADEAVHRTLMRLYARHGRRAAALRQYQLCTAALKRELGIDPEPATRALYRELLQSPPAARLEPEPAVPREAGPGGPVLAAAETSLVGRQAELALLRERRQQAWRGRGQLVAIVGEAGIGKTRLVEAMIQDVLAHGGRVLLGRSYASTQILPGGPWVTALRNGGVIPAIVHDTDVGGPFRSELARLIPEVGTVEPRATASAEERLRLFEAMSHVIETLARAQPLLLVLEDLHWSDDLSAQLLAFVTHRLSGWPVLALLTAREEEVAALPALGQLLAELDRDAHAVRVRLGPLTRDETLALIRDLARAGHEPAAVERLGDRIWKASGGNPFVAIETVRAIDEGAEPGIGEPLPVPDRVRDTILGRLERLDRRTQDLAAVAAVIGRKFSFTLVQRAAGLDAPEAARSVEELVAHQLLHVVDEQLDFTHERIREVTYARLLPPRRQLLHATVARAIETLYPDRLDELADRLAHHYAKTDLDDKAVEHLRRFAERAAQGYANAAAVEALKEALTRARRGPGGGGDDRILALLDTLSLSLAVLGRFPEILELLLPERDRAERVGDRALASAYFFRLGLTYSYLGQPQHAVTAARRALDEAEHCGSHHASGRACYLLALAAYYTGESRSGVEHARRGIACLERGATRADLAWLGQTWWVLGLLLYLRGEFGAALQALEQVEAVARRMGGEPRLSSFAAWTVGLILATRGQWDEGIERCRRSLAEAPDPVNTALARGRLATAYLEKGEAAEARPLLEQAVEQLARFRFTQVQGLYTAFLAEARRLTGDAPGAREAAERALVLTRDSRYPFGLACARRVLGRVALTAGELEAAAAELAEALAIFASIDARFEVARTQLELAELAHGRGDLTRATAWLTDAAEALQQLAVARYDERIRALRARLIGCTSTVAGPVGSHHR
jgi:DNA-binding SARP family transcriptional activator